MMHLFRVNKKTWSWSESERACTPSLLVAVCDCYMICGERDHSLVPAWPDLPGPTHFNFNLSREPLTYNDIITGRPVGSCQPVRWQLWRIGHWRPVTYTGTTLVTCHSPYQNVTPDMSTVINISVVRRLQSLIILTPDDISCQEIYLL